MEITIRQELIEDYHKTEELVELAFLHEDFSDKTEHKLVHRLRKSDAFMPELSLVAVEEEEIIGHILLSRIEIVNEDSKVGSLALAPVSVSPAHQSKGIGSKLIAAVLNKSAELGFKSVIVLGHKDYYPKFGFKPASFWNIKAPFEVPDELFMAMELNEGALKDTCGMVKYSSAFFE
jgi:predicted N-acetyltransferase YhbS